MRSRMVRTRCGWNHCDGWGGRAPPSSGGQMWAAGSSRTGMASSNILIESSQYWAACNKAKSPTWQPEGVTAYARADIAHARFTPHVPAAAHMRMCWERESKVSPKLSAMITRQASKVLSKKVMAASKKKVSASPSASYI